MRARQRLVVAAGAWTPELLRELGVDLPIEIHSVAWGHYEVRPWHPILAPAPPEETRTCHNHTPHISQRLVGRAGSLSAARPHSTVLSRARLAQLRAGAPPPPQWFCFRRETHTATPLLAGLDGLYYGFPPAPGSNVAKARTTGFPSSGEQHKLRGVAIPQKEKQGESSDAMPYPRRRRAGGHRLHPARRRAPARQHGRVPPHAAPGGRRRPGCVHRRPLAQPGSARAPGVQPVQASMSLSASTGRSAPEDV